MRITNRVQGYEKFENGTKIITIWYYVKENSKQISILVWESRSGSKFDIRRWVWKCLLSLDVKVLDEWIDLKFAFEVTVGF